MKPKSKLLYVMFVCSFYIVPLQGQETISTTGGNATGIGGSVSYTIGQVAFNTFRGTAATGSVVQGVQQPYEISIVKKNTNENTFEIVSYPNPTSGIIKLIIRPFNHENLRFQLIDFKGIIYMDKKVEIEETEISMEGYSPSVYFLIILYNDQTLEVLKIVKIIIP